MTWFYSLLRDKVSQKQNKKHYFKLFQYKKDSESRDNKAMVYYMIEGKQALEPGGTSFKFQLC